MFKLKFGETIFLHQFSNSRFCVVDGILLFVFDITHVGGTLESTILRRLFIEEQSDVLENFARWPSDTRNYKDDLDVYKNHICSRGSMS